MVRRQLVEEQVERGAVRSEHTKVGAEPHVREQGNLQMYSDETLYMRSRIKRSAAFGCEVKKLWVLVAPIGLLSKGQYVKMITKISRLIVPPPWAKEDMLQTAMDDWEKDLQWAKDHALVEADAMELNYEAFFKSIYELVDTWTETADESEVASACFAPLAQLSTPFVN